MVDSLRMGTSRGVGIIGGAPKCGKSWLGLDMAVSVASGTPCLDQFEVQKKGPVLVYLAEDSISAVRSRIEALCLHRRLDIEHLELHAITAPTLRLDLQIDQQRLDATIKAIRPCLLVLDPLVRLHRLDENSAAEISCLLGFLRELQRKHNTAIVLVHHASKKHHAQPGQALRGSSDLHAFGDSNAYLARKKQSIILTLEHRAAKPPDPIEMDLISRPDSSATHLEIISALKTDHGNTLNQRVLELLKHSAIPMPRSTIREYLKVNNQRLGNSLIEMDEQKLILKTAKGWTALNSPQTSSHSNIPLTS